MTLDEQVEKRVYERLRAFDGLEVAGHEPVDSSIASVLSEGEVLADDGSQYESIQTAVNNSEHWVFAGPGTYYENVVIDKDDFTLQGAGYDTLIDGGTTGNAITVNADNVSISKLSLQTDNSSTQDANDGIVVNNPNCTITDIHIRETDWVGILLFSTDIIVDNCTIETTGDSGVIMNGATRVIVSNCNFKNTSTKGGNSGAIEAFGDDELIVNNIITNANQRGLYIGINDGVIGGNRIANSGSTGIELSNNATDTIVFNNRISGSGGNGDLQNGGTGTVTDANLTGSAN